MEWLNYRYKEGDSKKLKENYIKFLSNRFKKQKEKNNEKELIHDEAVCLINKKLGVKLKNRQKVYTFQKVLIFL